MGQLGGAYDGCCSPRIYFYACPHSLACNPVRKRLRTPSPPSYPYHNLIPGSRSAPCATSSTPSTSASTGCPYRSQGMVPSCGYVNMPKPSGWDGRAQRLSTTSIPAVSQCVRSAFGTRLVNNGCAGLCVRLGIQDEMENERSGRVECLQSAGGSSNVM